MARTRLNEPTGASVEWERALDLARGKPEQLLKVASYAQRNGAFDTADAAYAAAIQAAPDNRAAYEARLELALARGQTAAAVAVLEDITRRWPADTQSRDLRAYLSLLVSNRREDAQEATRDVAPYAASQPANWRARATLALARLRLDQHTAAMAAFSGDRGSMDPQAQPGEDVPPGAKAVWAATLAANGWKTEATTVARQLAGATLLPEERALIDQPPAVVVNSPGEN